MDIVRGYYSMQVSEGFSGEVTLSKDLKKIRKGIYKISGGKSSAKALRQMWIHLKNSRDQCG